MKHVAFLTLFSLLSVVAAGDKELCVSKGERYILVEQWPNSAPVEAKAMHSGSVSPVSVAAVAVALTYDDCRPGPLRRSKASYNLLKDAENNSLFSRTRKLPLLTVVIPH